MGLIYAFGTDPGGTTGWAVIGIDEYTMFGNRQGKIKVWECGEVHGTETDQALKIMGIAARYHPLAFVIEDFDLRKLFRQHAYLSPVRVGARLEMCLDTHYILATGPFWQMPSLAMDTATDYRLQAWGLYKPGSEHARDGTRHAVTFIRRCKQDPKLARQAWPLYDGETAAPAARKRSSPRWVQVRHHGGVTEQRRR